MRQISKAEIAFLRATFLAARKNSGFLESLEQSLVETLNDGNMGSFRFFNRPDPHGVRRMGESIIEGEFKDVDGMPVSFAVDVDSEGKMFEVDIWRVDFKPLQCLPDDANAITIRSRS